MRTEIELKDQPVRARLYLTALGLVEAEINGAKVGNDALIPGWTNYEQRVEMWTYDVTENLSAGTNAMGFWLGDGWYRGRLGFDGGYANYYGDRIGVFAQLEVEYADGSTDAVYSNSWDRRWKTTLGPIVCSDLCEGERYDARFEMPGWSKLDSMIVTGSLWPKSSTTPPASKTLTPRRYAHTKETSLPPSNASVPLTMVVASGWSTLSRTAHSVSV